MPADLDFWHTRYTQQVGWTLAARRYIFDQIQLDKAARILETGSGTGALLSSLHHDGYAHLYGLDIDLPSLLFSSHNHAVCADAHHLPFLTNSFNLAICHFLLLWVRDPLTVIKEMSRVTQPGGWVVALAEPDYSRRVDKPDELAGLGKAQTESLSAQGADVAIGSRLENLFFQAGMEKIETGIIQPQAPGIFTDEEFELEWAVLRRDLAERVTGDQLQRWYDLDRLAAICGDRQHYVPIQFAFGKVLD
ncbi:MAG: methyltransferase domain-containing protein [Chloroflexi bacterium]|nr:methyltransferase domain-containing protein [Chloroflexota bacterium]